MTYCHQAKLAKEGCKIVLREFPDWGDFSHQKIGAHVKQVKQANAEADKIGEASMFSLTPERLPSSSGAEPREQSSSFLKLPGSSQLQ